MGKKSILVFVFFLLGTLSCFAQTVTLDEYLELVRRNHPFFKKEALAVDIERKGAESFPGAEDWNFEIGPFYSYLGEASAAEFQSDNIHIVGVEAAVERIFWKSGGRLGLSFETDYTRSKIISAGTQKAYRHGFGVSYTHPFLQNTKGVLDRLAYELSTYSIDLSMVQRDENQESFLADVAAGFLEWAYLSEVISIAKERLRLAEEQKAQTEKKFKSNLVDKVDVLRAEDAIRIAKQALLKTQSLWKAKQAELSVIAGSDELVGQSPAFDLYSLQTLPSVERALDTMKAQSRLLTVFDILKDQLAYSRVGLIEQKRPGLNLTIAGGLYGRDEEFGKSLEITKPDAQVSLAYFTTFGHRSLKAQIEQIELEIRQLEEDKKNVAVGLEASLRNIYIQIIETEKVLELNRAQIESAAEKTEEELKLYNQGRSQLTFVIQSRDNEENAKLTYAENALGYQQLLLQYRALMDELLAAQ
jgi:outer membrane protein TolC